MRALSAAAPPATTLRHVRRDQQSEFPFERIHHTIRGRILSGTYPPGSQLPSLQDFVAEFEHDIGTVRRAMRGLAADGLVVIRPGLGTFVVTELPGE